MVKVVYQNQRGAWCTDYPRHEGELTKCLERLWRRHIIATVYKDGQRVGAVQCMDYGKPGGWSWWHEQGIYA